MGAAFSRDYGFGTYIFSWLKATPTSKVSLSYVGCILCTSAVHKMHPTCLVARCGLRVDGYALRVSSFELNPWTLNLWFSLCVCFFIRCWNNLRSGATSLFDVGRSMFDVGRSSFNIGVRDLLIYKFQERINKQMERTLSIIKPDGVARGLIGEVIKRFEDNNLKIVAMKMIYMTKAQAQGFYAVHKERPFFDSLTDFMSSGPVVVLILKGENAIAKYRELMGATNYKDAAEGTIRRDFATEIEKNIVHGSDSPESADFEIGYFFNSFEVCTVNGYN